MSSARPICRTRSESFVEWLFSHPPLAVSNTWNVIYLSCRKLHLRWTYSLFLLNICLPPLAYFFIGELSSACNFFLIFYIFKCLFIRSFVRSLPLMIVFSVVLVLVVVVAIQVGCLHSWNTCSFQSWCFSLGRLRCRFSFECCWPVKLVVLWFLQLLLLRLLNCCRCYYFWL